MSTQLLEAALLSKLTGQASLITALGGSYIYNKIAPQPAPGKYVIFQWQGGGDENETKHRTRNLVYAVVGVASSQAAAAAIDAEIDAALHQATLTISGWTNFWTARETDLNLVETDAGEVVRFRVGGLYRIRIDNS